MSSAIFFTIIEFISKPTKHYLLFAITIELNFVKTWKSFCYRRRAIYEARKKYIIGDSVPVGTFSFMIELENVFGIVEDYAKVTYGIRHRLTLVRKGDNDAILRATGVKARMVNLTKVAWMMPRVISNDDSKAELNQLVEDGARIDVGYRMRQCNVADIAKNVTSFDWRLGVRTAPEKPRYILIALQEGKSNNQEKNA